MRSTFTFPNSPADFLARNTGKIAKLESDSRNAPLGKKEVQGRTSQGFLVRVTSIRSRLLDEDNLCEKYHVDLLRYSSGGILGDEAGTTEIKVSQRKAAKGEIERTIVQVFETF